MKNSQKFIILISCISLIISIVFILQTYAKYTTSVEGTTTATIARWNILINEQLIKTDDDLTNVLNLIFEDNPHILDGVWAPTAVRIF